MELFRVDMLGFAVVDTVAAYYLQIAARLWLVCNFARLLYCPLADSKKKQFERLAPNFITGGRKDLCSQTTPLWRFDYVI
jgi:hypothetical protein